MIEKKLRFIYLLNIIIVFCFTNTVKAQISSANRSSVSGYVFDTKRNPISQLPVELLNDLDTVVQRTKTDGSGRFFFRGLSGGRYSVRVITSGINLEAETQDIVISDLGALGRQTADNVQADFYLHARKTNGVQGNDNGVLFAQDIPSKAKEIYDQAVSDIDKRQNEAAIQKLQTAIKIFPDYYAAIEKLGLEYINRKKLSDAQNLFVRAVKINARSFTSWYGLCYANFYLQNSSEAIKAGKQAITLSPNVDVLLLVGLAQRQIKDYTEAEKTLLQAKRLGGEQSADVNWNLALLYAHNLNRYKDAANELELFLKARPNNPDEENIKKLIKQFRQKQ
jgi:tetratricopeptide (TPR) repeat protein